MHNNHKSHPPQANPHFYDNLLDDYDSIDLDRLGEELSEVIEDDDSARSGWLDIVTKGIDYLGIGDSKVLGADNMNLPRKSNIYSPSLASTGLKMSASICQMMFPANGFINSTLNGIPTDELEDKSFRVESFANHYFYDVATEYIPNKEEGMSWCVYAGSMFTKGFMDPILRRPVAPYICPQDIILSRNASSLMDSERITHQFTLTERLLEERRRTGFYKFHTLEADSFNTIKNPVKQNVDEKMGVNLGDSYNRNINQEYSLWEGLTYLDYEDDPASQEYKLPYEVTIHIKSKKIIRISRNWDQFDHYHRRINTYNQYKLYPGFGAYGMGLFHSTLNLASAETETFNQLMRAAELSNSPSLLAATGAIRQERSEYPINAGSITRIDTLDNNINNSLYQLQVPAPSQVLYQLKTDLSNAIKNDFGTLQEINLEDIPNNMAATTMLGVMGSRHVLANSVINGIRISLKNELQIYYKYLFPQYLGNQHYEFAVPGGEHVIIREDFADNISLQPSVDPNVASSTMQLMMNEALLNLADKYPSLIDTRKVVTKYLRSMHAIDPSELMTPANPPTPPVPPETDPVTENENLMKSIAIKAYKDQDHASHKTVVMGLVQRLSQDKAQDNAQIISAAMAHYREHDIFEYMLEMETRMKTKLPKTPDKLSHKQQNEIALKAAQATQQAQQEQQAAQQAANPPPPDSSAVMMQDIQVKSKKVDMEGQMNAQKLQLEHFKLQSEIELNKMEMQIKLRQLGIEEQKLNLENQKLNFNNNLNAAKVELDSRKNNVDTQSKALETAMKFESEMKSTAQGSIS